MWKPSKNDPAARPPTGPATVHYATLRGDGEGNASVLRGASLGRALRSSEGVRDEAQSDRFPGWGVRRPVGHRRRCSADRPAGVGDYRRAARRGAHQRRRGPVHHRGRSVPLLGHPDLADGGAHRRDTAPATTGDSPGDQRRTSPSTPTCRSTRWRPASRPAERAARAANYITGTAHPDPAWDGVLSISKQHDQGVVVLDAPATSKWPGITPAPLLPVGTLDANQGALKNETFTLVGYGVGDRRQEGADRRAGAALHDVVPQDRAGRGRVTFQINDRDAKAGGGSCFGDSGGPVFLGQYVVGDASLRQLAHMQRDRWRTSGSTRPTRARSWSSSSKRLDHRPACDHTSGSRSAPPSGGRRRMSRREDLAVQPEPGRPGRARRRTAGTPPW